MISGEEKKRKNRSNVVKIMEGYLMVAKDGVWSDEYIRYFIVDTKKQALCSGKSAKDARGFRAKNIPFKNLKSIQDNGDLKFSIHSKKRVYEFKAISQKDSEEWQRIIKEQIDTGGGNMKDKQKSNLSKLSKLASKKLGAKKLKRRSIKSLSTRLGDKIGVDIPESLEDPVVEAIILVLILSVCICISFLIYLITPSAGAYQPQGVVPKVIPKVSVALPKVSVPLISPGPKEFNVASLSPAVVAPIVEEKRQRRFLKR